MQNQATRQDRQDADAPGGRSAGAGSGKVMGAPLMMPLQLGEGDDRAGEGGWRRWPTPIDISIRLLPPNLAGHADAVGLRLVEGRRGDEDRGQAD